MRSDGTRIACRAQRQCRCRGGSAVSFVIALPLLLVFLFAVVDVGRTVYLHMALADAAHAACQTACASRASEVSPSALREAACTAAPALAASNLRLSIEVRRDKAENLAYEHRVYNMTTGAFEAHPSQVERQTFYVELSLEGSYLTPLGSALSSAGGPGGGMFLFQVQSSGVADMALEGERT